MNDAGYKEEDYTEFEEILRKVLQDHYAKMDKIYLKEIEEANNDPKHIPSPEQKAEFYCFLSKIQNLY